MLKNFPRFALFLSLTMFACLNATIASAEDKKTAAQSATAALAKDKAFIELNKSQGNQANLLQLDFKAMDPEGLISLSEHLWAENSYEKAYIAHTLAMIRLRALATVNADNNKSETLLENLNNSRTGYISEWAMGHIPRMIELIEKALELDEQLSFPALELAVSEQKLSKAGFAYAQKTGQKPYRELAAFLEKQKDKIYELRSKSALPIRDPDYRVSSQQP